MQPIAPFLAAPGSGRQLFLPLAAVRDLLVVGHADEVVSRYRQAMAAGAQFPPVAVVRLGRCYLLADGHKRLRAFRALLAATSPARVQLGSPDGGCVDAVDTSAVVIPVEWWTWRRWCADQLRQARGNWRKNRLIVRLVWRDPRTALALARTTFDHWRRVARSLLSLAVGPPSAKRCAAPAAASAGAQSAGVLPGGVTAPRAWGRPDGGER